MAMPWCCGGATIECLACDDDIAAQSPTVTLTGFSDLSAINNSYVLELVFITSAFSPEFNPSQICGANRYIGYPCDPEMGVWCCGWEYEDDAYLIDLDPEAWLGYDPFDSENDPEGELESYEVKVYGPVVRAWVETVGLGTEESPNFTTGLSVEVGFRIINTYKLFGEAPESLTPEDYIVYSWITSFSSLSEPKSCLDTYTFGTVAGGDCQGFEAWNDAEDIELEF